MASPKNAAPLCGRRPMRPRATESKVVSAGLLALGVDFADLFRVTVAGPLRFYTGFPNTKTRAYPIFMFILSPLEKLKL
jgi:hypothetical protein